MKSALDGDTFIVVFNKDARTGFQNEKELSTARRQMTDDGFQLTGNVDMRFKASGKQVTTNLLAITFDKTA